MLGENKTTVYEEQVRIIELLTLGTKWFMRNIHFLKVNRFLLAEFSAISLRTHTATARGQDALVFWLLKFKTPSHPKLLCCPVERKHSVCRNLGSG